MSFFLESNDFLTWGIVDYDAWNGFESLSTPLNPVESRRGSYHQEIQHQTENFTTQQIA
jgi:hypothetical protein